MDFYGEKTSSRSRCVVGPECETRLRLGVPPLPLPSEWPTGRGSGKKCPQNLEGRGVRGQNLDNKRVSAVLVGFAYAAFASTMIN